MRQNAARIVGGIALAVLVVSCTETPSPEPEPPVAPTNVVAEAGRGHVTVTWDYAGATVASFEIARSEAASSHSTVPWSTNMLGSGRVAMNPPLPVPAATSSPTTEATVVGSVAGTERAFTDVTVESGSSYTYAVTAIAVDGTRSAPGSQTGSPVMPAPPGVPPGTNPDDTRYLAAVVVDADGFAVPDAFVSFVGYDASVDKRQVWFGETDDEGVAVLTDTDATPGDVGTLEGYIAVEAAAVPNIFLELSGVSSPGTIVVSPSDPELDALTVHVTDAGVPTEAFLQLAPPIGGIAHAVAFHEAADGTLLLYVSPGDYPFILFGFQGFQFVDETGLSVAGPTEIAIEIGDFPTSMVELLPAVSSDAVVTRVNAAPIPMNGWSVSSLGQLEGPILRLSPLTYRIYPSVEVADEAGSTWEFDVSHTTVDLAPSGTSVPVTFGAPMSVGIEVAPDVVVPGESVTIQVEPRDASGALVRRLVKASDGIREADLATVAVRDPSGVEIFSQAGKVLMLPVTYEVPVGADAGTYEATVTIESGPFGGVVSSTVTFEVVAGP